MKLVFIHAEDAGLNALYMDGQLVIDARAEHLVDETISLLVDYGVLNAESFTVRRLPYRYYEQAAEGGYPESLEDLEPYLL